MTAGNNRADALSGKYERYLQETPMLDYGCASIRKLIRERGWKDLPDYKQFLPCEFSKPCCIMN